MPRRSRKSDIGGYTSESDPQTLKPFSRSIPARAAMAVPQIPMRYMFFGLSIKTSACHLPDSRNGRLQQIKFARSAKFQTCAYTERDDNIRSRSVSSGEPVKDRKRELAQKVEQDLGQRVPLALVLNAVQHLSKNNTFDVFEFAGLFEVSDHSVDLVRL